MELSEPLFDIIGFDFTFASMMGDLTQTAVDFYQVFLPIFALICGLYIAKMMLGFMVVPVRVALQGRMNSLFSRDKSSKKSVLPSKNIQSSAEGYRPSWQRGINRYETRD